MAAFFKPRITQIFLLAAKGMATKSHELTPKWSYYIFLVWIRVFLWLKNLPAAAGGLAKIRANPCNPWSPLRAAKSLKALFPAFVNILPEFLLFL